MPTHLLLQYGKGSLSKYMGISNDEKNTIHKKNEEYNVIPTDAQIYVGNSEQHVCLGKMTGSVRLTNRVLACKGKIYSCNIKQCLRCKKYFIFILIVLYQIIIHILSLQIKLCQLVRMIL